MVIDHTSYAVSETEGDHTLIASDDFIQSDVILGEKKIEASLLTLFLISCTPFGLFCLKKFFFFFQIYFLYRYFD